MNRSICKLKQKSRKRVTFCRKKSFTVWSQQIVKLSFTSLSGASTISHTAYTNLEDGGAYLLIGQNFPKTCMEMKGIGLREGARPGPPPFAHDNDRDKN